MEIYSLVNVKGQYCAVNLNIELYTYGELERRYTCGEFEWKGEKV
jgi:hypothetical protein